MKDLAIVWITPPQSCEGLLEPLLKQTLEPLRGPDWAAQVGRVLRDTTGCRNHILTRAQRLLCLEEAINTDHMSLLWSYLSVRRVCVNTCARVWVCKDIAATAAKSLQSCPTLCDPIDGSLPGSPVPGILQARTLEWVAISSNAWKWSCSVVSDS